MNDWWTPTPMYGAVVKNFSPSDISPATQGGGAKISKVNKNGIAIKKRSWAGIAIFMMDFLLSVMIFERPIVWESSVRLIIILEQVLLFGSSIYAGSILPTLCYERSQMCTPQIQILGILTCNILITTTLIYGAYKPEITWHVRLCCF